MRRMPFFTASLRGVLSIERTRQEAPMADVVMVLTIVVAMTAMFAFAAWLDRI